MSFHNPSQQKQKTKTSRIIRRALLGVAAVVSVIFLLSRCSSDPDSTSAHNEEEETWIRNATWTSAPYKPAIFGTPGKQEIHGLTAVANNRLIAVGESWSGDGTSGDGTSVAAVWISDDLGNTWKPVAKNSITSPGNRRHSSTYQTMHAVTTVGSRLVAVGEDWPGSKGKAAVWVSDDHGDTWTHIPQKENPSDRPNWQTKMNSVTWAGKKKLVAVGADWSATDSDAAVWTSNDRGNTWTRILDEKQVLSGQGWEEMAAVTWAGEKDVVAVGNESKKTGNAAVWISQDSGNSWIRLSHTKDSLDSPEGKWMRSVTRVGERLVAVGEDWSRENNKEKPNGDPAVWISDDHGRTWNRTNSRSKVFRNSKNETLFAIASDGANQIVAAGYVESSAGENPRDAAVWVSDDKGDTWARAESRNNVFSSNTGQAAQGMAVTALRRPSPLLNPHETNQQNTNLSRLFIVGGTGQSGAAIWIATPSPDS